MSAQRTPPHPDDDRTEHHRAALDELLAMAMNVTRLIHADAQAKAEAARTDPAENPFPAAPIAEAFERAARIVRRTIALARHLDDPVRARAQQRQAARRRIIREVEDAIERHDPDGEEDLHAEFYERLERPELDADIDLRPLAEIIDDFKRDLGLAAAHLGDQPWKRRTPEDIVRLCARAAAPSQPPSALDRPAPHGDDPERIVRLVAAPNTA